MSKLRIFLSISALALIAACGSASAGSQSSIPETPKPSEAELAKLHKAYFASGCFWCVEAIFESVQGVEEAVSGYAGGAESNPTYQQVSYGRTGHAEAVEVYYDSSQVDFPTLVKVFFGSHDPTTLNRQGPDAGRQYRSVAFYENAQEKQIIEDYMEQLVADGTYKQGEITTEVTKLTKFWKAEDYHQDYERQHPNNRYIQAVSIPRLKRFQRKYPELLKSSAVDSH